MDRYVSQSVSEPVLPRLRARSRPKEPSFKTSISECRDLSRQDRVRFIKVEIPSDPDISKDKNSGTNFNYGLPFAACHRQEVLKFLEHGC